MPSVLHEQIVDDIMTVINIGVMPLYPDFPEHGCVGVTSESSTARFLFGFDLETDYKKRSAAADLYISGGDDCGVILGEVGDMNPDKWRDVVAIDGLSIRVLRVTKDRACGITNMRMTRFESDLLSMLNKWLSCPDKLVAEHEAQIRLKNQ